MLWEGSPVPRHRVLTSFAERLTGFKITDATELEDIEPEIPHRLSQIIATYHPIHDLDRLYRNQFDSQCDISFTITWSNQDLIDLRLIQCLVDILRRWTVGGEATVIPIEHDTHEIISLGIGFLDDKPDAWELEPDLTYPVYISEPLVVLSLGSLFDDQSFTNRQEGMKRSLRLASNTSSLGYVFEEVVLVVLMDNFGGKSRPLSEVFECNDTLGSRKVTLVSLTRGTDGTMCSHPVSWKSGCSDHFGFKARSPKDVLAFFDNPDGKVFLFPDNQMGPDLFCFVQDEETKELILLAVQAKVSPNIASGTWISALNSITPDFFYTIVVGIKPYNTCRAQPSEFTEGGETESVFSVDLPNTDS